MEEILSSIKRIIAEEGDSAVAARTRRSRPAPVSLDDGADEVLELSQPAPAPAAPEPPRIAEEKPMAMGAPTPPEPARPEPTPVPAPAAAAVPPQEPILSDRAVEATRGPLEALSRMVIKPEVSGSDTLEGLVREMLKPMLRDWLDANLPQIVETMVAREIARITAKD